MDFNTLMLYCDRKVFCFSMNSMVVINPKEK